MSSFAKIKSDYAPNTYLMISQSDDGDIGIKICGDGEMRIATSGGFLHGRRLCEVIEAFVNLIKVLNNE